MSTYKHAGVDIEKGDRFASYIGSLRSPAVSREIGGFAGGTAIDTARYKRPVVLSTTDGVGTKLIVAKSLHRYDTIGIDLVAMCVNDLIVCNAEPVSFLDYIACGGIDEEVLHPLIGGIIKGCELAECTLSGGETAEMPDMYAPGDIDLAGFAVGVGEETELLPAPDRIAPGDLLYGLPSSGIHSNGLSLARKILSPETGELYEQLLVPTKIYVREMKTLFAAGSIAAAAHITGGGIEGNLKRVLPAGVKPALTWDWEVPPIFTELQERGSVSAEEMRRVFNMGIGIIVVVKMGLEEEIIRTAGDNSIPLIPVGVVEHG